MKKLALVRWRDAYFEFERSGDVSEREDYLVETVGWYDDNPQDGPFVSVVSERLPEEDGARAVTNIPASCVVDIVYLQATRIAAEAIPEWFTQEY